MTYTITPNTQFNSLEVSFSEKPNAQVIQNLKALRFRWHGVKHVWYGYTDEETLKQAIENDNVCPTTEPMKPSKFVVGKALKELVRPQYEKVWDTPHMVDYCTDKDNIAIVFEDGFILPIEKKSITTSFCFGYGYCGVSSEEDYQRAHDNMVYADTNEEYFIRKNTEYFDNYIENLQKCYGDKQVWISGRYSSRNKNMLVSLHFTNSWELERDKMNYPIIRRLSDDEIMDVIEMYQQAKDMMMKRLRTYLKRYGLTKLHTWTYLVD